VHGGAFYAGDLDMPEADAVARAFSDRGAWVASVDYRLADAGRRSFPHASDDVLTAWSWMVVHAAGFGVQLSRLFLGGASAGANLATGAVMRMIGHPPAAAAVSVPAGLFLAYPTLLAVQPPPPPALRAALDAWPEADVFGPRAIREMYEAYLGDDLADPPLVASPGLASPSDLAGFPPTIIINGDTDELRVSAEIFADTLRSAGHHPEMSVEPGTSHGHLNRPSEPGFEPTIRRASHWFRQRAGMSS